jgi:hypothetical protein
MTHTRTEVLDLLDPERRPVKVTAVFEDFPAKPSELLSGVTDDGREVAMTNDGNYVTADGLMLTAAFQEPPQTS